MNEKEQEIARKIWPQHMPVHVEEHDPYYVRRQQALQWLGDRYLLAQPINRRGR